jgi:hypothetical protein
MYNFITASKDASIYLQQPNQNTGLDEILEVSKVYYGSVRDYSRALIRFDLSYLSQSIVDGNAKLDEVTLVMRETQSEEIPLEYTLYAHAVSGSWDMGIGTRFDEISTAGVTWRYREGDSKKLWLGDVTTDGILPNLAPGSTGSYDGRGGVWYSAYTAQQEFSYTTADIHMDVKNIVQSWVSGSIKNDGFIIKFPTIKETDTKDYGIVKLFSKETHTIYQPKIRIGWDDQIFNTGSLSALVDENIKVGITNFKKEYKLGTQPKLRVFGRELYPLKTFVNQFSYKTKKYLPETTYYQIKDFNSNDIIIPFGEYSKVSCDSDGNYIKLDLRNCETNRVYKIEFKIDIDGSIQYFDDDITFIVVN